MSDKPGPDDALGPADLGVLVIFGAAGDLTKRKLIPALYNLAKRKLLPSRFAIVGVARAAMTTDEFRRNMTRDILEFATADVEPAIWDWFVDRLYFVSGHFDDADLDRHGAADFLRSQFGPRRAGEDSAGHPAPAVRGRAQSSRARPVRGKPDRRPARRGVSFGATRRTGLDHGNLRRPKLLIDNWRWADVPFYIRTGKHLPKRVTEIAVQFKRAPFLLFRKTPVDRLTPNWLVLHIQPDEGISLQFGAKVPGPLLRLGDVDMSFTTRTTSASRPAPATSGSSTTA